MKRKPTRKELIAYVVLGLVAFALGFGVLTANASTNRNHQHIQKEESISCTPLPAEIVETITASPSATEVPTETPIPTDIIVATDTPTPSNNQANVRSDTGTISLPAVPYTGRAN